MKILEVVGLTCHVGAIAVLDALSFTLEEGEILALCGPAGAGKTACLRCLGGSLPVESGRLIFDGREVTGLGPRELAQQGLVRAGQLPSPPWPLTVADAVALAVRWPRLGATAAVLAKWPGARARTRVAALLDRVGLSTDARRRRDGLPVAAMGRLALAQALALRPRLLLLDDPLGRLPVDDRPAVARLIGELRAQGVSILLAEREPAVAKAVADRVATLERGAVMA
ncbi:MAG TPA: ATP-binding cassette domain-containing protein [Methylomirabilota bacterium]|nr:ATP-binding cassette domain-containing protein [Methylomirabilota bacterium]